MERRREGGRGREADKKAAEAAITNPLMSKLRKRRRRREGGGVTRMANSPSLALWKCSCRRNGRGREGHSTIYQAFLPQIERLGWINIW